MFVFNHLCYVKVCLSCGMYTVAAAVSFVRLPHADLVSNILPHSPIIIVHCDEML